MVAALAAFLAAFGLVGSDALWLVPLGDVVAHGHLPSSIPYAAAQSTGWHDVPALGELVFWALYHALGGVRGLALVQAVGAATAFAALAHGLRRETSDGGVLLVSSVVLIGSLGAVVVTAPAVFSVALFAVLLAIVESDARTPSRAVWWAVPLLALWGNLHGGALAGLGLLACYLVLGRARREPGTALAVLAASVLALGINPTLLHTPEYYGGVLDSEVARHGEGLWAPLGSGVLDVLLVAAAVTLLVLALTRVERIRLWEAVALLVLVPATVHTARNGVWLVFVAAYPAARGLRVPSPRPILISASALILAAAAVASIARGPVRQGAPELAREAARTGQPILAQAFLGQQVVLAGGRVWIDNPIDAFRRPDQRLYLDWLAGKPSGDRAVDRARYVLVRADSKAGRRAARDPRLTVVENGQHAVLYRVRRR